MYLTDSGELVIEPIEEYKKLEKNTLLEIENASLSVKEANTLLKDVSGDMLRIELTIDPGADSEVGAYVKYDFTGAESVKVSYDTKNSQFSIDASKSSLDMRNNGAGGGTVALNGEEVKLTIFVDRAMVEAYLNGKNQVTAFGYNTSETADGLKLYSSGNTAVIKSLTVYKLGSSTGYDVPAFWN